MTPFVFALLLLGQTPTQPVYSVFPEGPLVNGEHLFLAQSRDQTLLRHALQTIAHHCDMESTWTLMKAANTAMLPNTRLMGFEAIGIAAEGGCRAAWFAIVIKEALQSEPPDDLGDRAFQIGGVGNAVPEDRGIPSPQPPNVVKAAAEAAVHFGPEAAQFKVLWST